jgi:hypothetical protein
MTGRYDDNALMHRHIIVWMQTSGAGASATTLVLGLLLGVSAVVHPEAPADDGDAARCAAACTEFRLWGRLAEMPKLFPIYWTADDVKMVRRMKGARR